MEIKVSRKIINFYTFVVIFLPLVLFISSFVLEYIFKIEPCNLCLLARYIYFSLFISLLFYYKQYPLIVIITSLCGFFVSVYHKLLQMGYLSYCPSFFSKQQTFESFQLMLQNTTPCSAKASLFGVDFVWFNIVLFFTYLTIFSIKRYKF